MLPLEIDGRSYDFVARHRPHDAMDSRIYKGNDAFVRVGPAQTIQTNLAIHTRLEEAGFPVPKIFKKGAFGDEEYFVEESFGEETFRLQFADEVAKMGEISQSSFDSFMAILEKYLRAQAHAMTDRDIVEFLARSHVERLCYELPTHATKILDTASMHLEALAPFPFVLSHGDLSPNNIFPKGVIDLEEALPAPYGFDAVCALTTCDWYPENGNFEFEVTPYRFTAVQRSVYLAMCDVVAHEHAIPPISESIEHFDFFRAVWLTEGMGDWPVTQKYRYDRFVTTYLPQ